MLAELWKRLTSMILPRVIPIDPPSEGGSMLLITLRGAGGYGDGDDFTYGQAELPPPFTPTYMQITESRLAEVKPPEDVEISHIIIYVRAAVLARTASDYTQSSILYGNPIQRVNVQAWPVSDGNFETRHTGPLSQRPGGGPWTFQDVFEQMYGCEVHWNGLSFVPGEFLQSEVWVEVYGRADAVVRSRKFQPGVYQMRIGNRSYVAAMTAENVRSVYEAARGPKEDGTLIPLSFSVISLDNGAVIPRNTKINSTVSAILAAIAEAKQPDIG